jgi:hypothetical protein
MNVRKGLLLGALLVLFCSGSELALAAPAPPQLMVNHQSRQCAEYWGGDECVSCSAPAGWEVLKGWLPEVKCPDGYAEVKVDLTCTPHKAGFCCTEGHSGAAGDCEDVVLNRELEQCAFVPDINECPALPRGWEKYGRDCPYYAWGDQVKCLEQEVGGGVEDGGQADDARLLVAAVLCLLACSLPLLVLLIVLGVWLWRRRSKPSAEATDRKARPQG